jgi:hypothetical protein
MENPVSYHQHCPVCGRSLLIAVTLLGHRVYCQHCGGGFLATSEVGTRADGRLTAAREQDRLHRVDELIERASLVLSTRR